MKPYRMIPLGRRHIVQALAFLTCTLLVMAFYTRVVGPRAQAALNQRHALQNAGGDPGSLGMSPWIVLRDMEQQVCFILMAWGLVAISFRVWMILGERRMLLGELVHPARGEKILPADCAECAHQVQALPRENRERLLPRTMLAILERFSLHPDIAGAKAAGESVCAAELARLSANLALVRYIAWAVPSVGFIGTVRGIGLALARAGGAMDGNIDVVTDALGVAFNSTFIALLISMVLMACMHLVERMQEGLVDDVDAYCDERLVRRLHHGRPAEVL
jgi:biopolymer transport protein ExbB/TolQ